jgi:hypothetical protein
MANPAAWFVNLFKDNSEDDKAYWDEKAAQLHYLGKLRSGEICLAAGEEYLPLQQRAYQSVGHVDFNKMMTELEVDTDYRSLTRDDVCVAVGIGIMGVAAAHITNLNAESLEAKFKKIHEVFQGGVNSGPSPSDYRSGHKHRYYFGHDFNIFQKLPENYTVNGENVGGMSLYGLLTQYIESNFPGSGPLTVHFKAIMNLLTHYLSDLPTKDGLPLPFTSLFTRWVKDPTKASGYSASNPVMEALGREFGTINAADIASYAVMKVSLKGYLTAAHWNEGTPVLDKQLHEAQMSSIAYGTAMIMQLLLVMGKFKGMVGRTGKLNYFIAGPFIWSSGRSVMISEKMNKKMSSHYEQSIAVLEDSEKSFDEWVAQLCE